MQLLVTINNASKHFCKGWGEIMSAVRSPNVILQDTQGRWYARCVVVGLTFMCASGSGLLFCISSYYVLYIIILFSVVAKVFFL